MNRSELIAALSEHKGLTNDEATQVIEALFDSIKEALTKGDRVEIRGFGSFKVKEYDGYTGRNPKTGEEVQVLPKKLPCFRVGKELRDVMNDKMTS